MSSPVGLELFCGCGGFSTGFLDAGLNVVAGFDKDRPSVEAYRYNHEYRGSSGYDVDLAKLSGKDLLGMAGLDRVNFLVGGPPCQPFSVACKQGGSQDPRSNLIGEYLRIVREVEPDAVIFENVPNLLKIENGAALRSFIEGLEREGFEVSIDVRAASQYGVPQMRRRLLLIAARGVKPDLPPPSHGEANLINPELAPFVTSRQALCDLPAADDFEACGIHNHEPTEHTSAMLERFSELRPGDRDPKSFHDRLHPNRPSFTLRAGTGNFSPLRPVHYDEDRVITVRESARLQSFEDQFIWPDWIPRLQQYRQVGNAVPPLVARALAIQLARTLGWDLDPSRLKGDVSHRRSAVSMSDAEKKARRRNRTRGASLGKAALNPSLS